MHTVGQEIFLGVVISIFAGFLIRSAKIRSRKSLAPRRHYTHKLHKQNLVDAIYVKRFSE